MSTRRLIATAAVMALIAAALTGLGPHPLQLVSVLRHPQHAADTVGPEAVVLAVTAALAWLVWAWGALGLALTAASAVPGAVGAAARLALRVVLPAGARRGAAVLLGIGLGLSMPTAVGPAAAEPTAVGVAPAPDWPVASDQPTTPPVPDWPADRSTEHLVVRGDCLWTIATGWLQRTQGRSPTDAEVAAAVPAWWRANAAVIGADPDLIVPGQVLTAPEPP